MSFEQELQVGSEIGFCLTTQPCLGSGLPDQSVPDPLPMGGEPRKTPSSSRSASNPCAEHGAWYCGTENQSTTAKRHRPTRQKCNGITKHKDKPTSTSRRARYTLADDAKIHQLKEQGLSWIAIAKHFPGHSTGAIEARYHTKLKTADPSRSGSRQLYNHSRALSPVVSDDSREEE